MYKNDIIAIWDLHWNLNAYYWNMRMFSLIDIDWNWIWWDKICVFLWDILADRNKNWMDIFLEISKLKKQANADWWDIIVISWNHDYKFILYLCTNVVFNLYKNSFIGLFELRNFASNDFLKSNELKNLRKDSKNIKRNLINSDIWNRFLDVLYNMKLVHRINDIVFMHTNPVKETLELLYKYDLDYINSVFQNWIKYLFENDYVKWDRNLKEFWYFCQAFLIWNRRINIPIYKKWWCYDYLYEKWIKYIVNWHNWCWWVIDTCWNMKIIDIDYSFWKIAWENLNHRSVLYVSKNWKMFIWARQYEIFSS